MRACECTTCTCTQAGAAAASVAWKLRGAGGCSEAGRVLFYVFGGASRRLAGTLAAHAARVRLHATACLHVPHSLTDTHVCKCKQLETFAQTTTYTYARLTAAQSTQITAAHHHHHDNNNSRLQPLRHAHLPSNGHPLHIVAAQVQPQLPRPRRLGSFRGVQLL
jgi:hypothetical protein